MIKVVFKGKKTLMQSLMRKQVKQWNSVNCQKTNDKEKRCQELVQMNTITCSKALVKMRMEHNVSMAQTCVIGFLNCKY